MIMQKGASCFRQEDTGQSSENRYKHIGTCALASLLLSAGGLSGCLNPDASTQVASARVRERLARAYEATLRQAMTGSDRLLIRESSPVSGWRNIHVNKYEARGTATIESLLFAIVVDPVRTFREDGSFQVDTQYSDRASVTLDFLRNNECLGRLEIMWLHSVAFSKPANVWRGQVCLEDESMQRVARWLAGHGAKNYSMWLAEEATHRERERQTARDAIHFWPHPANRIVAELLLPEKTSTFRSGTWQANIGAGERLPGVQSNDDGKDTSGPGTQDGQEGVVTSVLEGIARIRALVPDPRERCIAACRTLGIDACNWSYDCDARRLAIEVVRGVAPSELRDAVMQLRRLDDHVGLIGAAELFFAGDPSFRTSLDRDVEGQWLSVLLESVLRYEESFPNRYEVLEFVVEQHRNDALDVLRVIVETGESAVWVRALEGWMSIDVAACLAVALLGDSTASASARELLALDSSPAATAPWIYGCQSPIDKMGLELSLALLGEYGYLKAEQFVDIGNFHAPFDISDAAREALRRFNGRDGVALVIEGIKNGWVDNRTRALTSKMVGLQCTEGDDPNQALLAWWNMHGEAFVRERRENYEARSK